MVDKEAKTHAFALLNGHYKATGNFYSCVLVDGSEGILKEPSNAGFKAKIKVGDFGEADPEIVKASGQKIYNIQFTISFGKELLEHGIISEDGLRITMKNGMGMGICELEWITKEEADKLEAAGDPIDAPPGEYKIQPEYQGTFLWITGPPGLGKSTSAQLLGKTAGYVYYEADCYGSCRNPYIPVDVPNPSMAQVNQNPLKGEGLDERKEICNKATKSFMKMFSGEEYDKEPLEDFYAGMCADILSERKRIGGDWAIAAVTLTRDLRNLIR